MNLILASQSPRRRELLGLTGLDFIVRVADIDETMDPEGTPFDEVARVSRRKAMAVPREKGDVVIAADTIVVCEGQILGKPRDEEDAFSILSLLSGRHHEVMTGMTVLKDDEIITHTEVTKIHFRDLHPEEIRAYIASGEPMDKAGAYGIQGGAALFADEMVGDYYNVMGLPVCRLAMILRELELPVWGVRV